MEERFENIIQEGMNKYLSLKGLDSSRANNIQRGNALTEFYIREIGQYLYGISPPLLVLSPTSTTP